MTLLSLLLVSEMACIILLLTISHLLPSTLALNSSELSQMTARIHIEQNTNSQGSVSVSQGAAYYTLESNGIPDHSTGSFPDAATNPNSITLQTFSYRIAVSPATAASATCLPGGPIAFSKNGIPIFNPLNALGQNAVEGSTAEVFDSCDGHPDNRGVYHYHQTPDCLYSGGNDEFIGVALDGFPIYGIKNSTGANLTTADLDDCHGQMVNGEYRYRLTRDWPYIMACFKGTPSPDIRPHTLTSSNCQILGSSSTSATPTISMFGTIGLMLLNVYLALCSIIY